MSKPNDSESSCVRVMYDGACPLCTREIQMYRKLDAMQSIEWVDVSRPDWDMLEGKSRAQLMQRFHVRSADGEWLDGARAFVYLWQQLPRWRYLAKLCAWPGVMACMEFLYTAFLHLRPALQRWARRRT